MPPTHTHPPDFMILGFKIDWDLERNKMRFRTHWVSGWFIDSLKYHHHIDLSDAMPRLARVMNDLADERALTHARVTHFQQHHSHVAHLCNDIVIQTIDTLERYSLRCVFLPISTANVFLWAAEFGTYSPIRHTVLAKKMSEEVDEWILELERRIQASKLLSSVITCARVIRTYRRDEAQRRMGGGLRVITQLPRACRRIGTAWRRGDTEIWISVASQGPSVYGAQARLCACRDDARAQ